MLEETRTLERKRGYRGVESECVLTEVTGSRAPLPKMIDEGPDDEGVRGRKNTSGVDHVGASTGGLKGPNG
jgi:hypothetical protein